MDFSKKIAEALNVKLSVVEEYFDVDEDKQGFFYAKLKPKKFLDKFQFRTLCDLARKHGGEGYVEGAKAWKVPSPLPKVPSGVTPNVIKDDKSKPPLFAPTNPTEAYKPTLADFEQKCVLCDSTQDLVIHHKKYGALLKKEDFVVLCRPCHTKYHVGGKGSDDYAIDVCGRTIAYVWRGKRWHCKICMDELHLLVLFDSEQEFTVHLAKEHSKFCFETIETIEKEREAQWENMK
jgi:hypothetical protein